MKYSVPNLTVTDGVLKQTTRITSITAIIDLTVTDGVLKRDKLKSVAGGFGDLTVTDGVLKPLWLSVLSAKLYI